MHDKYHLPKKYVLKCKKYACNKVTFKDRTNYLQKDRSSLIK